MQAGTVAENIVVKVENSSHFILNGVETVSFADEAPEGTVGIVGIAPGPELLAVGVIAAGNIQTQSAAFVDDFVIGTGVMLDCEYLGSIVV